MRSTDMEPIPNAPWGRPGAHDEGPATSETVTRAARRINRALHRLALSDHEARAHLQLLASRLLALAQQVQRWATLEGLLHAVLASSGPFRAAARPAGLHYSAGERKALFQNWHLCQQQLDALADFADRASTIGLPFRWERLEMAGERWAVEPIALRLLIEDALKDPQPDPEGLLDLADEFQNACQYLLEHADRALHSRLREIEGLLSELLEGLR